MSAFEEIRAAEETYVMHTYGRQPVALVRGDATHVYDADGREILDFVAGIAVMSVGHSHPAVVEAITEQARKLTHVSNLYYTEPQVRLAERLHGLLGWGRAFFTNSGAEANECAIKLARKYTCRDGDRTRVKVVAALGSFHGRTIATLAATGQPKKHEPFSPLPGEFIHVPLGDVAALEAAVSNDCSAILLEVVQGEGGINQAPAEFLRAARALCDERGSVLIFDEVQTGLGRTGAWFAYQHSGVIPDIITLAKALGGGLPIGACIAREEVAASFGPGDHATTFGGGPVPCAAALAVLDVLEKEDLVANSAAMGERLVATLREKTAGLDIVTDVRGLGLLVAVQLGADRAAEVVSACLDRGLLVNNVTPSTIRLSPPLVVSSAEIDLASGILVSVLGELA